MGTVTVLVAVDAVIAAAKRGKIPVFTVIPPTAKKGALFDLGAKPVVLWDSGATPEQDHMAVLKTSRAVPFSGIT